MLEVSEAVGAFRQNVCCVVGQNDTFFGVTTARNSLGVIWFRIGISGGLCEYNTGICEHGTGTVAEFMNTVLDQWRTM